MLFGARLTTIESVIGPNYHGYANFLQKLRALPHATRRGDIRQ